MPLYEYQCRQCGARTEALQRMDDPPMELCEACGGELRRLLSSPSFQFKGSGWYVTDYARKGSPEGGKKAVGNGASAGGSAEKGSSGDQPASRAGESGGDAGAAKDSAKADSSSSSSASSRHDPGTK